MRSLIDLAVELLARDGGPLARKHAVALWGKAARETDGVTDVDRKTLQHIANTYIVSADAKAYLMDMTSVHAIGERYYALIDGVQVDRTLWERVELRARDGRISLNDARKLWVRAHDGPGVTQCEVRTIRLAIDRFVFTDGALQFMEGRIAELLASEES